MNNFDVPRWHFRSSKRVAHWHALCIGSIDIDNGSKVDDEDDDEDGTNNNNNWRRGIKSKRKQKRRLVDALKLKKYRSN